MVTNRDLRILQEKISEVALERGDAKELEAAIRRNIRSAGADLEMVMKLQLLLGSLFRWTKEPAKSRAQYHKVLKQDPTSVEAMIGIGDVFEETSRLNVAKRWFQTAYTTAEEKNDYAGQLAALDALAFNADERDDAQALTDALSKMCCILALAPRMEGVHGMIAEWLIMKKRGAVALPFLECLIKHRLKLGYSLGYQYMALRPFVEIQRQEGRSDEEISSLLAKLRPLAADESVASDFDIASEWAFERGHYKLLDEDKA